LVSGGVPQQLGVEQCAMFAAVGAINAIALDDLCGRLAAVYVKLTCARQSALHLQCSRWRRRTFRTRPHPLPPRVTADDRKAVSLCAR
jgi:hypothetical protein